MTIVKYKTEPLGNLLGKFLNESETNGYQKNLNSFVPNVDIAETQKSFEVQLAVPGMKNDDFTIDLNEGKLTISGERKFDKEENGKSYHAVETQYGSFSRSFYLPDNIVEENIKASYKNGLLMINIPKAEKPALKKIKVG